MSTGFIGRPDGMGSLQYRIECEWPSERLDPFERITDEVLKLGMSFSWTEIWAVGLFGYGVYIIVRKPPVEVGFENSEPLFFLGNKGKYILGIICIFIGLTTTIFSLMGFPVFN